MCDHALTRHLVRLARPRLGDVALAETDLSLLVLIAAAGAMLQALVVTVPPLCPFTPTCKHRNQGKRQTSKWETGKYMSVFPITNKLNLLCKERTCVVSHQECSLRSSGHSASVQWSSSSVSNLVCLPGSLCFPNKSLKWTRSWLHRFASRVSAFFSSFQSPRE